MEIPEIKAKLKDRLSLGLNYGLQSIEEILLDSSVLKNDLVTSKSQYNDLNRIATQGLLGYEQVEIGYNKIRQGLLELIDRIESRDVTSRDTMPKIQNNELQNRKENFFELLKIHFNNLENIEVVLNESYGEEYREEKRKGREAISFLYNEIFLHNYQEQKGEAKDHIGEYTADFFEKKFPRLEAYMKTLTFIIRYIDEVEIDQPFFFGVVKSILSANELSLLFYYALSGYDPGLSKLLIESGIVDERIKSKLLKETHFDLVNKHPTAV